jgi:polyphosphate kinase
MSENIEAVSVVDKFLEHTRLFIFCNNNQPKVFISSADFMTRNIENRVEVTCPIYDEDIKAELMDIFDIYKKANAKARILNQAQDNLYKKNNLPPFRAQFQTYEYYINKLKS